MFKSFVIIASLTTALAGSSSTPTVSASIKDTTLSGVEGLNLQINLPYKYQDYEVGVKYTVGDLKKLPDSVYLRKSFDTPLDGRVHFDSEFTVEDQKLSLDTKWDSAPLGLSAFVNANSKDNLVAVGIDKILEIPKSENKVHLQSTYNVLKNKVFGSVGVSNDQTNVEVSGDSVNLDPILSVTHAIDQNHVISPSISLRTGKQNYFFSRKWLGGSASANVVLGERVAVSWTDIGAAGVWTTTADVPLTSEDKPKITFTRDWAY